jgi:hypothetical protein
VEHGTHFVKSEPYMIPEEEDEDSCF